MGSEGQGRRGLSRRDFLRAGGGTLAGAYLLGLAGCGGESGGTSGNIKIPDSGAKLPKGDVTFRLVDSGDLKVLFWDQFFPAYENKHSNVTAEYDGLPWEEIEEVVPLGIRNGSAHDLFALPPSVTGAQAVRQDWVAPLDDAIPNFEDWKSSLPKGTLVEGVHQFNGKTYTFPICSNQRYENLLLYNSQLMEGAGYDPSSEPLTWEKYREAARKITRQGDGRAFGTIFSFAQPPILELQVGRLAHAAGAPSVGLPATGLTDPKTGEFVYDSDEVLAAIELLLALKSDKSVFPGSTSALAPETWSRLPQGVVGMTFGGPWVAALWLKEAPDFEFGVASEPLPAEGEPLPLGYSPANTTNLLWLYSKSQVPEVAGDVLAYVSSVEGQKAWASITGGVGDPPLFEEARSEASQTPQAKKSFELADGLKLLPDPVVRNPEVGRVYGELETITPSFGEVVQGVYVGEISDPASALQDLQDKWNAELERAIGAARQKGADVSRDDWVFPNWNPQQDYTPDMYDSL